MPSTRCAVGWKESLVSTLSELKEKWSNHDPLSNYYKRVCCLRMRSRILSPSQRRQMTNISPQDIMMMGSKSTQTTALLTSLFMSMTGAVAFGGTIQLMTTNRSYPGMEAAVIALEEKVSACERTMKGIQFNERNKFLTKMGDILSSEVRSIAMARYPYDPIWVEKMKTWNEKDYELSQEDMKNLRPGARSDKRQRLLKKRLLDHQDLCYDATKHLWLRFSLERESIIDAARQGLEARDEHELGVFLHHVRSNLEKKLHEEFNLLPPNRED